jgi:serine protease Do
MARRVVESLIKQGKVVRGWLGVRIEPLNTPVARKLNLSDNRGALVIHVEPGSPADRCGLKFGDVIVKLANQEVADPAGLRIVTAGLDVGAEVPLTFYRDGKTKSVTVKIEELPPAPEVLTSLGFRIQTRPAPDGSETLVEISQVVNGSPAFQAGLRPGMRIFKVGEEPVKSLAQFEVAVRKHDITQGLPLLLQSTDGRLAQIRLGGGKGTKSP